MPEMLATGARTFYGVPAVAELAGVRAQVAFLGVPFDGGTPQPGNRTGQKLGPAAARHASWEQFAYGDALEEGARGWYDIESDRDRLGGVTMIDVGDVVIQGADDRANFARMREAASMVVGHGCVLVAFGGDHSISFPLVSGVTAHHRLQMVHVDAHADFWDELDGSRFSGASQLRRIAELPRVDGVTALGLRNVEHEEVHGMREFGVRFATTLDLVDRPPRTVVDELVPECDAIYLSIDLDVLDLGLVPGTTLPEPGGLSYRQLRATLAAVAGRGRVVAVDVAELNPPADTSGATARLATWLITHLLSEMFDQDNPHR
ncbi:MAG TPA: arginase family protein [Solirubrobacteraceae bacterium]|nr:arginase family protein [Solirubrobacteraceae bacterium]